MENLVLDVTSAQILLLEAFYGGSHKQLIDTLAKLLSDQSDSAFEAHVVTLPPTKWHWRARTGALALAGLIPRHSGAGYRVLFSSSVFSLPELLSLRPDLASAKKIVYFHENQLAYPLRRAAEKKDYQYGYNQILSALVATHIVFNSDFNRRSFYEKVPAFLNSGLPTPPCPRSPDPKRLVDEVLQPKSSVLHYLVDLPPLLEIYPFKSSFTDAIEEQVKRIRNRGNRKLKILWNHRWDYDKNPTEFFRVIFALADIHVEDDFFLRGAETLRPSTEMSDEETPASISQSETTPRFHVSVLGGAGQDTPRIFTKAEQFLRKAGILASWGFLPCRHDYWRELVDCDVVVSTADHEFFGVSVVEAVSVGCVPLCPNRLAYPELIRTRHAKQCLYCTPAQLQKRLRGWVSRPDKLREIAASALEAIYSPSESDLSWLRSDVLPSLSKDFGNQFLALF